MVVPRLEFSDPPKASAAEKSTRGIAVRVGCRPDDIFDPSWERFVDDQQGFLGLHP